MTTPPCGMPQVVRGLYRMDRVGGRWLCKLGMPLTTPACVEWVVMPPSALAEVPPDYRPISSPRWPKYPRTAPGPPPDYRPISSPPPLSP